MPARIAAGSKRSKRLQSVRAAFRTPPLVPSTSCLALPASRLLFDVCPEEAPFVWLRAPSGDDASFLIVPVRIDDGNFPAVYQADRVDSHLAVIETVVDLFNSRPLENPFCIVKGNSVLCDVSTVLLLVPTVPHRWYLHNVNMGVAIANRSTELKLGRCLCTSCRAGSIRAGAAISRPAWQSYWQRRLGPPTMRCMFTAAKLCCGLPDLAHPERRLSVFEGAAENPDACYHAATIWRGIGDAMGTSVTRVIRVVRSAAENARLPVRRLQWTPDIHRSRHTRRKQYGAESLSLAKREQPRFGRRPSRRGNSTIPPARFVQRLPALVYTSRCPRRELTTPNKERVVGARKTPRAKSAVSHLPA